MSAFEDRLGYAFRDPALLREALTHRSAVKEGRSCGPHYQRLEFLGDAVVQLIVSRRLFFEHPGADEGALSFLRQDLVRSESLAAMAERLGVKEELVAGNSAGVMGRAGEISVLGDVMEALLGAVFLDGGLPEAEKVLLAVLPQGPLPDEEERKGVKSALQERIQKAFDGEVPAYETDEDSCAGEEDRYRARVYHRGRLLGEGRGRNKKRAEEAAARDALGRMGKEPG